MNVTFTARSQAGVFSDRIELRFIDVPRQYRFVIWRRIVAEVGNQKDLEELRPKSEYVPPPRVIPVVDPTPLKTRGEPYSNGFRIKWAKELLEYAVPGDLRALFTGDRKGLTGTVKKQFVPSKFSLDSYSKFWSALLHVEEIQQEYVHYIPLVYLQELSTWYRVDLLKYSLEGVRITKEGRHY